MAIEKEVISFSLSTTRKRRFKSDLPKHATASECSNAFGRFGKVQEFNHQISFGGSLCKQEARLGIHCIHHVVPKSTHGKHIISQDDGQPNYLASSFVSLRGLQDLIP
jgi:hypothetical protein